MSSSTSARKLRRAIAVAKSTGCTEFERFAFGSCFVVLNWFEIGASMSSVSLEEEIMEMDRARVALV